MGSGGIDSPFVISALDDDDDDDDDNDLIYSVHLNT
jgi:hypothetical protein